MQVSRHTNEPRINIVESVVPWAKVRRMARDARKDEQEYLRITNVCDGSHAPRHMLCSWTTGPLQRKSRQGALGGSQTCLALPPEHNGPHTHVLTSQASWQGKFIICIICSAYVDTSRSTSGYPFLMGGAAISWSRKLQGGQQVRQCLTHFSAVPSKTFA